MAEMQSLHRIDRRMLARSAQMHRDRFLAAGERPEAALAAPEADKS